MPVQNDQSPSRFSSSRCTNFYGCGKKAFDKIKFMYLFNILKIFWFGNTFISLDQVTIHQFLQFLTNNTYSKQFPISRGTRQGLPALASFICNRYWAFLTGPSVQYTDKMHCKRGTRSTWALWGNCHTFTFFSPQNLQFIQITYLNLLCWTKPLLTGTTWPLSHLLISIPLEFLSFSDLCEKFKWSKNNFFRCLKIQEFVHQMLPQVPAVPSAILF